MGAAAGTVFSLDAWAAKASPMTIADSSGKSWTRVLVTSPSMESWKTTAARAPWL
ncbi:hypothetical protein D3C86_2215400 [compost metagenome]